MLQLEFEKTKRYWQGRLTQTIAGKEVYPRPVQDKSLVDSYRWSCRINSEDCSGWSTDCICYYWWYYPRFFKKLSGLFRDWKRSGGHAERHLKVGPFSWGWIARWFAGGERLFPSD